MALHFALESRPGLPHPAGHMRTLAILTVALCLAAAAIQSRAAETNSVPLTNTIPLTIGTAQASAYYGKQVTVTGVVAQISARPSVTFLNFDQLFPSNRFTAIIRKKSTNEFENVSALKGKAVAVTGKVIEYRGKPEMELTNKSQLKVLGGTK